ncbi:hypothetical protein BKI52_08750 [marine bacterium AO1-C]|nr:hypothetical protein BKI52_08750 [marine bacterium AO1-C]
MDKKDLQRMLQQKFATSSVSHSSDALEAILRERVGEWQQEMKDSEGTLPKIQQQLVDNIQGFCATYLYESLEKKTFELKSGEHYQALYDRLQQLSEMIKKQNSLNDVQEVLLQV